MQQLQQWEPWLTFVVNNGVGGLLSSREPLWAPRGNQEGIKSEKIVLSGSPGGAFGLVPGLVPGESDQRLEYLSSSDHTRLEHRDRELPITFSS